MSNHFHLSPQNCKVGHLNSSETTAESLGETNCNFVFDWNAKSVLTALSVLIDLGYLLLQYTTFWHVFQHDSLKILKDFCRFRSKAEKCRNGLFFKKAFTFTAHQLILNKIERGFTLYKIFVNYTPGFKSKLFSIVVNTKINASKSYFFCLKIVFIFLFELKRRELKFVKSSKRWEIKPRKIIL